MKPFKSAAQMLNDHETMFGAAGKQAAQIVLHWASKLFAKPIDPLSVRVVLAPNEMGAYNMHTGYHRGAGAESFILGNRHECHFHGGDIVFNDRQGFEDFIVHELTHRRQQTLLREHEGESTKAAFVAWRCEGTPFWLPRGRQHSQWSKTRGAI
jgi:hypothetical protein